MGVPSCAFFSAGAFWRRRWKWGDCKEKVLKNSAGKKDGFRRVKAFGMVK
jgi:hypothetical protein